MADKPQNLIDRSRAAAKDAVDASIRSRYFPEIWYVVENWFLLVKVKRAVDVGSGRGLVAEALAKLGWDVTAVEASEAGLERLRASFDAAGLNVALVQGEADNLPFPNGAFEAVASINALEFSSNPYAVMRELSRVLAPGGRAVVATFNKLGPWGLPAVARRMRPDEEPRSARFLSKDEFGKVLKASGLEVADVKERACYLPLGGQGLKVRLPVAGAYVALLAKPLAGEAPKADKSRRSAKPAGKSTKKP